MRFYWDEVVFNSLEAMKDDSNEGAYLTGIFVVKDKVHHKEKWDGLIVQTTNED
jgi:hypothetical protein